jgi:cytochrome c oxidase accessory protein FixG
VTAPTYAGRVLPTLNEDGSRRWIRPHWSRGPWSRARLVVGYALMGFFLTLPHLRWNAKPWVLLDLPRREFTFFGTTFLPTDTLLLMLLGLSVLTGIFLITALWGRAWCGWGCPQTIYMEFVFRPIERLIEGGERGSRRMDAEKGKFHAKRWLKHLIFLVIAAILAHTFLAYFVGTDALAVWIWQSPFEHPTPFLVMAVTTLLILADFGYFREQVCLVACPYGRWQSALLDKQSLIVAYDYNRGEPRGHGKDRAGLGDCVDCNACVVTCPTGIDIRQGLQMECIHCTQCMDACDTIMQKVNKPRGLIRYSSQAALAGQPPRLLRPRTVLYPLAFVLFSGTFVWQVQNKAPADVTLLGPLGAPYRVEQDGRITNQVRVRIANRTRGERAYTYQVLEGFSLGATVIAPVNPLVVPPGEMGTASFFIQLPAESYARGVVTVTVRVTELSGFSLDVPFRLTGPGAGLGGGS